MLGIIWVFKHECIIVSVDGIMKHAGDNSPQSNVQALLNKLVNQHLDVFRDELSHDPPESLPALRIELMGGVKPLNVKLRNYFEQQQKLFSVMTNNHVMEGMTYLNPTDRWA